MILGSEAHLVASLNALDEVFYVRVMLPSSPFVMDSDAMGGFTGADLEWCLFSRDTAWHCPRAENHTVTF